MAVNITTKNTSQITGLNVTNGTFEATEAAIWDDTIDQPELAESVLNVMKYVAAAIAVPLTILNVVVFLQKSMRSATGVYVIGLSVAQLVYVIPNTIGNALFYSTKFQDDYAFGMFSIYGRMFLALVARRGSHVVTTLVSLERLYAIARPLHVKTFFLHRRPIVCTTTAYVIAALFNAYIPMMMKIKSDVDSTTGQIINRGVLTDFYLRNEGLLSLWSLGAKVVLLYCGLLAQILVNVLTVWCLRRHNLQLTGMQMSGKEGEAKSQRERQLTVTILATTVCYAVLSLPQASHYIAMALAKDVYAAYQKYHNLHTVVENLTYVLSVASCAVDFVCFFLLSSNYRRAFFKIFGRKSLAKHADAGTSNPATQTESVCHD